MQVRNVDFSHVEEEVVLARKLGDLHQMLYTRGGIRPANAAVEELSKLLLLRIAADRFPDLVIEPFGSLESIVDPDRTSIEGTKQAFTTLIAHPELAGRLPDGGSQPVWPLDEPLRLTRADVLVEALRVLEWHRQATERAALDPLGTAFDVFLSGKYEHAGGLGTYLTPSVVAATMAKVGLALINWDDQSGAPIVVDPCCGTGRFLVAALEQVRSGVRRSLTEDDLACFSTRCLIGADQSPSSVAMARVNLLSYGIHHPSVFSTDDSITARVFDTMRGQVDLILTNPPFGEGKYDSPKGIQRTTQVFPHLAGRSKIDPALAFVARCLDLLTEGGVVGIVLPDGIIESKPFQSLVLGQRRLFGPNIGVEALISLPSATFSLGGTMAKTSALFMRKGSLQSKRIYVARAEHVGYLRQGGAAAVDPGGNDLPAIGTALVQAMDLDGSHPTEILYRRPLVAGILRNDFRSLQVGDLDPGAIEARESIRLSGGMELRTLLRQARQPRREQLRNGLPFVSVLHVDDLGTVAWREARTYRPSTPGVTARADQILVSLLNPRNLRATVIPTRYPLVQCSAEFGVFETDSDPYALLALLQHPLVRAQLAPLGRGTSSSRRRIEAEDVLSLLVPNEDREWWLETGRTVRMTLESFIEAEGQLLACYRRG